MPQKPKLQATLDGYLAWAWGRLLRELGESNHSEVARMVFREWLDLSADKLDRLYSINRDRWKQETGSNVTRLPDRLN